MRRHKDIESWLTLFALLIVFGHPASTPTTLAASLALSTTRIPAEIEKPQRRCEILAVPEAGRYWLMTTSQMPSSAPTLMVLGLEGSDPRTEGRVEMTLLDFAEPGQHAFCRTSSLTSEITSWALEWAGDPSEGEDVLDPQRPRGDDEKAGDEYEIEEVIDP